MTVECEAPEEAVADLSLVSELVDKADLVTPMVIRAAVRTGLIDALAGGGADIDALTAHIGGDRRAVTVVIDHLRHEGLVAADAGGYELTAMGALLTAEHEHLGLRQLFDTSTVVGASELSLTNLHHTVLTGRPASEFGSNRTLWQELDEAADTDASGTDLGVFEWDEPGHSARAVIESPVWKTANTVVDLGGNTGSLMLALLTEHTHLHGAVLDFPVFTARAAERARVRGLTERMSTESGSFFDPLPTGYDVYLFSAILADWSDEDCLRILRRAADAAGRDGTVVVAEAYLLGDSNLAPTTSVAVRLEASVTRPDRDAAAVAELIMRAGLEIVEADISRKDRSIHVAKARS